MLQENNTEENMPTLAVLADCCNEDNTDNRICTVKQAMYSLLPSFNAKMVAELAPYSQKPMAKSTEDHCREPTEYVLTGVVQSAWKSGHHLG